jgi:predicted aspartyl protease
LGNSDWVSRRLSFWGAESEKSMMHGVVNSRREATFPLVVGNLDGQKQFINTVIDTGFDGFLSLPAEMITRFGLPWTISNPATLGDGSEVLFDFCTGTVI